MSAFEVVQAMQSTCIGVVGLDLTRTVVVFRSVDDQDVGERAVIRLRSHVSVFFNTKFFIRGKNFPVL